MLPRVLHSIVGRRVGECGDAGGARERGEGSCLEPKRLPHRHVQVGGVRGSGGPTWHRGTACTCLHLLQERRFTWGAVCSCATRALPDAALPCACCAAHPHCRSRDKTVWLWEAQPGNEYEVVDVKHGHSQVGGVRCSAGAPIGSSMWRSSSPKDRRRQSCVPT